MDTLNAVMPINWTVVQGMSSLPGGKLPLYDNPDWAKGFDIVIHNECWANGDLPAAVVQNITRPAVARMFFHCSLHSYRVMTDDSWRELIGVTSRRHTRAHNILLKWADGDPITADLPPFVTPIDELYVLEKIWPGTKAVATAVSPEEDHATYPVVWTHDIQGRPRVRHVPRTRQRDVQHESVQGTGDARVSVGLEEGADCAAAATRAAAWRSCWRGRSAGPRPLLRRRAAAAGSKMRATRRSA